MRLSQNISDMKQILAAFIFFTRLPFWKITNVPSRYFKHVVNYWPMVGYLTGGLMALTLFVTAHILPLPIAVILTVLMRLLITGALHEDGLADFCDGFGGGTSRERILEIMKDSHIGTYGVIGLILYYTLLIYTITSISYPLVCSVLFCGDIWAKYCSSHIINILPYARKEEESKAKIIYDKMPPQTMIINTALGLFPTIFLLQARYIVALVVSALVCYLLIRLMKKRLQGYTGDCCGALFLITELSFYIIVLAIHYTL